jgi:dTDP-4-dehydrorhamnose reductase
VRLLVTGARGLLGTELVACAAARGHDVIATGRAELDVTSADDVRRTVEAERPAAVVHLAAYTAVDGAEADAEAARTTNAGGSRNVAAAAARAGAVVAYVSTDYVFDGAKHAPYLPDDAPRPLSVYGATKLEGERAVLAAAADALVVRTSWLYGAAGRNFVTSILKRAERGEDLRVVDDQTGAPTWARHTAGGIVELLEKDVRGVWHLADRGACTWLELAREALRLRGVDAPVAGVSSAEWGAAAARPAFSVLDVKATEALLGRSMVPWREALARFLDEWAGDT